MRTRHFARILLLTLSWSKLSKWLFSADGCQGWQWNYRWLCVRSRLYRDIRRSRCREWRSAHFRHHQGFCRFLTQINIDLRSGYLTWHSYGKWPICRWCTDVPIKMVSFHGYVKQPKGILIYILCLLCESLSNFWRSLRLRCSIFGSLLGSCPRLWRFSGMPKLGCSLGICYILCCWSVRSTYLWNHQFLSIEAGYIWHQHAGLHGHSWIGSCCWPLKATF